MQIADLLNSEAGLTLLGAALGGFWTLLKSTEWYARARNRRAQRALLALEAGVDATYESYVRAIKEAREDGKLTAEERREARRRARLTAAQLVRAQGIDIARELGEECLDVWINRLVGKVKSRS